MEKIEIPNMHLLLRQFRQVDSYLWYCSLLKQYAVRPYLIHGVPAPCFVARMFVSHQKHDPLFGIYEVKEFLQPIVTSTFFLNLQTPGNANFERGHKVKDIPTFVPKIVNELDSHYQTLLNKLAQHEKILKSTRRHQEESWKLESHMNQRKSKLNSFLTSMPGVDSLTASKPMKIKLEILKKKEMRATQSYKSEIEKLNNSIRCEKAIRQHIRELSAFIKEKVVETATKSMGKAITDMLDVVNSITHKEGFQYTMNQLWDVDIRKIIMKIFEICSSNYVTPIPEDFIAATGTYEKIPMAKDIKPDYAYIWHKKVFPGQHDAPDQKELKNPFEDEIEITNDDCFFDKNGGVKTVLKKNLPPGPRYGIIDIRNGYDVKMKLSLWNNTIGFGWTKKRSPFSKKTWGYFLISEEAEL